MGRRQAVRHRFLVPTFPGSNPGAPATCYTLVDRHAILPFWPLGCLWRRRQASSSPRPLSRLAVVKELSPSGVVGKRGAGSVPRKVNIWRLPSAPPVVLPDRRGPRGGLCRCGGAAKRARASDENFQPRFRHATGPAPPPSLIPGAHQVPVRAMPEIMREAERAWIKKFSVFFYPLLEPRRMFQLGALHSVQHPSSDLACASLRLGHLLPHGEKERRAISALQLIANDRDRRRRLSGLPFSPCGRRCLSAAKADEGCSSLVRRAPSSAPSRRIHAEATKVRALHFEWWIHCVLLMIMKDSEFRGLLIEGPGKKWVVGFASRGRPFDRHAVVLARAPWRCARMCRRGLASCFLIELTLLSTGSPSNLDVAFQITRYEVDESHLVSLSQCSDRVSLHLSGGDVRSSR